MKFEVPISMKIERDKLNANLVEATTACCRTGGAATSRLLERGCTRVGPFKFRM
ncbi:MAG: hypothetical protein KGJ78_18720 [Alphaproteobacteria bacterium]|nr:hypothetical protein [Alphaproteobacteria bacterium]